MWKNARSLWNDSSYTRSITLKRVNIIAHNDIDNRLESLVTSAWKRNSEHFPTLDVPEVLHVLSTVGDQAVSSSRGGKRLRALLLATTAQIFSQELTPQQSSSILDLATAIEVFQTAALVHDDIIDDADMRRGQPSAHRSLETHVGNAQQGSGLALMLGDLLATLSVRTAYNASQSFTESSRIFQAFLDMHDQVELGQIMDISMESLDLSQPHELEKSITSTYINKTASYTTVAPLEIGLLASGRAECIETAHSFAVSVGHKLGVAFQIHDDLLDLIADPQTTGKPVGGDIREGKRTYILAQALQRANSSDHDYLVESYMQPQLRRSPEQINRIRDILIRSGAVDASISAVEHMWTQSAQEILALCMTCNISAERAQDFIELCQRFVS